MPIRGCPSASTPALPRPGLQHQLPGGVTLVLFTDGLVEHHEHPLYERLATLARLATQHASQPPERLCRALLDNHPDDGSDDIAILALRLPPQRKSLRQHKSH